MDNASRIRKWKWYLYEIADRLCFCFVSDKTNNWREELSEPLLNCDRIELTRIEPYGNVKYSHEEIIKVDVDRIGQITLSEAFVNLGKREVKSKDYIPFEDVESSSSSASSSSSGLSSVTDDEMIGYQHTKLYATYGETNKMRIIED